jgi:hypothetical protein
MSVGRIGANGWQVVRDASLSLYEQALEWLHAGDENDVVTIRMRRIDARACELWLNQRASALSGLPGSQERHVHEHLTAALSFAASHDSGWFGDGAGCVFRGDGSPGRMPNHVYEALTAEHHARIAALDPKTAVAINSVPVK